MANNLSQYEIGSQMLAQRGYACNLTREQFELMGKIMSQTISKKKLNDVINKSDEYLCCAALLCNSSEDIKLKVLDKFASICYSPTFEIFIPLLFASDKTVLKNMSKKVSQKLVNLVSIKNVVSEIEDYLNKNPDTITLPFYDTYAEQFLLKKILYSGELSSDQMDKYNTYKIIEYYLDEDKLKEILGDLSLHNELVRTAIVNNPFLSDEYRNEAFLLGADIENIILLQDSKAVKNIYNCATSGIIENCDVLTVVNSATRCINNLVQHNLLPESCELDLVKKITNNELPISPDLIKKIATETPYQSVLKEIIYESKHSSGKILRATIDRSLLKNPATTVEMTCDILKRCMQPQELTNLSIVGLRHTILTAMQYKQVPIDLCNKLMLVFPSFSNDIIKQLVLNPQTSKTILEQIVNDKRYDERDRVIALFNIESAEPYSTSNRRKFLNTVNAIIDVCKNNGHPLAPVKKLSLEEQYLPTSNHEVDNAKLKDVLNKIIDNYQMPYVQYAKVYIEALKKKEMHEQLRKMIPLIDLKSTSLNTFTDEELQILKEELLDMVVYNKQPIIDIYGTHKESQSCFDEKTRAFNNIYTRFCAYKSLILYSELYKDITKEIESRNNHDRKPIISAEEKEER